MQNGNTALAIAKRLGYISVVDTLKVVTEEVTTTTTVSPQGGQAGVPASRVQASAPPGPGGLQPNSRVHLRLCPQRGAFAPEAGVLGTPGMGGGAGAPFARLNQLKALSKPVKRERENLSIFSASSAIVLVSASALCWCRAGTH